MMNFFDAVNQINREASVHMPDDVAAWGAKFEGLVQRKTIVGILETQTHAEYVKESKIRPKGTIWYDMKGRRYYAADIVNGNQTWLPIDE